MKTMSGLTACFLTVDITPPEDGHPLLGYFNQRLSHGVLDSLHARLALFSQGGEALVLAQIDTCLIPADTAQRLCAAVSRGAGRGTGLSRERIMVFASHTHTAPALADLYDVRRDEAYAEFLEARMESAASRLGTGKAVRLRLGRGHAPGLASNRRWHLKDGRFATNPPRGHPLLDRPEGPVDDEVNTGAFVAQDGSIIGMLVSISNHADTVGGTSISADWPGLLEVEVGVALGSQPVVIPVIGAAGNINHFDFSRTVEQTPGRQRFANRARSAREQDRESPSHAEARRIAHGYAEAVVGSLQRGVNAETLPLGWAMETAAVPGIEIDPTDLARARDLIALPLVARAAADLTAEDIFRDDPSVERMFAQSLVDLAERGPLDHHVPLQAFRIGSLGLFAIPGEPFVETGLALKRTEGFDVVMPVGLANGYFGYIPPTECFTRGGYEVKPGPALLSRDAERLVSSVLQRLAQRLRGREQML